MNNSQRLEFPVTIYENLEKVSPVLSKARCRIFYKGENRNATFITDEFAEKLISTLPYTPVKGIYDEYEEDFSDHGDKRDLGRIYGIVPEKTNFAWEKHLDEDGVEREYACCDVLIFSALYAEASQITEKPQSMELYQPSIKGSWQIINGKKLYKFEDACFLGLQILGNEVEPCFEGAAFFSLFNELKQLMNKMEAYGINFQLDKGGKSEMNLNFKLSDSQKHDALWNLLNHDYNEENGWVITYAICDVYDDYALARNYETGTYERVYYTKNDETDEVVIGERINAYILDVTEAEKAALDALRIINNQTFEKIDEVYNAQVNAVNEAEASLSAANEKIGSYEQKTEELNGLISTLTMEKEEAQNNYATAQDTISSLTEENTSLKQYKLDNELKEKQAIISSYSELLDKTVLEQYTEEKIASYSVKDLDKELAYELKTSNPSVFSKGASYVPKDDSYVSGVDALLAKYVKKD